MGRNLEVYVGDMKSLVKTDHLVDLKETFETPRKYQLKLNPTKCSFGVATEKFLGHMISENRIEVNPENNHRCSRNEPNYYAEANSIPQWLFDVLTALRLQAGWAKFTFLSGPWRGK